MLILQKSYPPMKKLTQPWKLRRSFGSQPVGNVDGPRWPEAGITAQVIPSQSSRRTLRGKVDTNCRPADLPTCRPADLPTCRPASSDSSDVSTTVNTKAGDFALSLSSRPHLSFQGTAIHRTHSPELQYSATLPNSLSFSPEPTMNPPRFLAISSGKGGA